MESIGHTGAQDCRKSLKCSGFHDFLTVVYAFEKQTSAPKLDITAALVEGIPSRSRANGKGNFDRSAGAGDLLE
jgi:hypothetical protein